jgi:hypothetical protein
VARQHGAEGVDRAGKPISRLAPPQSVRSRRKGKVKYHLLRGDRLLKLIYGNNIPVNLRTIEGLPCHVKTPNGGYHLYSDDLVFYLAFGKSLRLGSVQKIFQGQIKGFRDFYNYINGRNNPLAFYVIEVAMRNTYFICQIYDGNFLFGSFGTDIF